MAHRVDETKRQLRRSQVQHLQQSLTPFAAEIAVDPPTMADVPALFRAAFLVDGDQEAAFFAQAEALRTESEALGFMLTCTGPTLPFSFVRATFDTGLRHAA